MCYGVARSGVQGARYEIRELGRALKYEVNNIWR